MPLKLNLNSFSGHLPNTGNRYRIKPEYKNDSLQVTFFIDEDGDGFVTDQIFFEHVNEHQVYADALRKVLTNIELEYQIQLIKSSLKVAI